MADTGLIDNQRRVRRICLQLLPQRAHGHPQIIDMVLMCGAPNGPEEMVMGQYPAAMFCEFA